MKFNKKLSLVCIFLMLLPLAGCGKSNKDAFAMKYDFKYAQIKMMNGKVKKVRVDSWSRDDKANNIRVTTPDGTSYYSSSDNIMLIDN